MRHGSRAVEVRTSLSGPFFICGRPALSNMAQKPPIGKSARGVTDEFMRVKVEMDLDSFYARLLNETRELLADLGQQGIEGEALGERIESGLSSLSDTLPESLGRASTSEAFNLGRNLGAQQAASSVREVVRTEVLDENTCDPCRRLDGTVVEMNSEEYFRLMPPNFCDGRDFCRGFYLYRA